MTETPKILTGSWDNPESHLLRTYEADGGYSALKKVLSDMTPEQVIDEVKASGVRGRGGAGFPAGMKWGFVPQGTGKPIYLCVNCDESEPGTNKDRELIERTSHQLIEGAIICAYAIRAHTIFFYIRGEFDLSYRRIKEAADEAFAAGHLGKNIHDSGFDVDFLVHKGAASHCMCLGGPTTTSLETALLPGPYR